MVLRILLGVCDVEKKRWSTGDLVESKELGFHLPASLSASQKPVKVAGGLTRSAQTMAEPSLSECMNGEDLERYRHGKACSYPQQGLADALTCTCMGCLSIPATPLFTAPFESQNSEAQRRWLLAPVLHAVCVCQVLGSGEGTESEGTHGKRRPSMPGGRTTRFARTQGSWPGPQKRKPRLSSARRLRPSVVSSARGRRSTELGVMAELPILALPWASW